MSDEPMSPPRVSERPPGKRRKKCGRRRLSAGMPRLLPDHRGAAGTAFRRAWGALVAEHGQPVRGSLLALEFGRTALALVRAEAATRAWLDVETARARGKGRRPSVSLLARLQKRSALEESSATSMLDRLRAMVPRSDDAGRFAARVRGNGQGATVQP